MYRDLGQERGPVARVLLMLAQAAAFDEDYGTARSLMQESLAIAQADNNARQVAAATGALADLAAREGDYDTARRLGEHTLASLRSLDQQGGVTRHVLAALISLGDLAVTHGHHGEALARYRECLAHLQHLQDGARSVHALEGLAGLAAATDEPQRALRLAGAAAALRQRLGIGAAWPPKMERRLKPARLALAAAEQAAAWAEGATMTLEQAVAYALEEPAFPREAAAPA